MHYRAKTAARAAIGLILAHGAGLGQSSPFMVSFATALALRGMAVTTFNFLYREQGRRAPDDAGTLEACYGAVIAVVRERARHSQLAIGGKSLGGRIASHIAASCGQGLAGLILLGYPLHPPGKPTAVRSSHLANVQLPILFIQGSRDPFGTPEELRPIIAELPARTKLYVVEDGDHSFRVRKSSGLSQTTVYDAVQDQIAGWLLTAR